MFLKCNIKSFKAFKGKVSGEILDLKFFITIKKGGLTNEFFLNLPFVILMFFIFSSMSLSSTITLQICLSNFTQLLGPVKEPTRLYGSSTRPFQRTLGCPHRQFLTTCPGSSMTPGWRTRC